MKDSKNAVTFLFLLSLTKWKREKNIEKTLFVSAGAQKGWESVGDRWYFTTISTKSKK